jgi:outer membrane protein assembly factor BamA
LLASHELRFPLIGDNIGGVFFHDAGNVYSSVGDISFRVSQRDLRDFDYMVHAVGFGIRYRTPIGPIRVDLAYGPNTPRFFGFTGSREELLTCSAPGSVTPCKSNVQRINVFQFHFSLGQAF